jgi:hypothetical protein
MRSSSSSGIIGAKSGSLGSALLISTVLLHAEVITVNKLNNNILAIRDVTLFKVNLLFITASSCLLPLKN